MSLCRMLFFNMYAPGRELYHIYFCATEWMVLIVMPRDIYITNHPMSTLQSNAVKPRLPFLVHNDVREYSQDIVKS